MIDRPKGRPRPLHEAIRDDEHVVLLEAGANHAVAAVRGQVLVGEAERRQSPRLASELEKLAERIAEQHPDSARDDEAGVGLWLLRSDEDPTKAVEHLRSLSERGQHAHVSPNHVLVPCPSPHWCPAAAPEPAQGSVEIPQFDCTDSVSVVVIDAGWVEVPLLAKRGGIDVVTPGSWRTVTGAAAAPATAGIVAGGSGQLPAIAGHATFIVGEIAARCPNARILVVNHDDPWTDEWSVAASLARWGAADDGGGVPDVVSCGYATATFGERASFPFVIALQRVAPGTAVLAPAGNQDSPVPHWPAAFKRVIGVGAFDETQGNVRASFSNHGPWVDCSAGGRDVLSTFLPGSWAAQDGAGEDELTFGPFATWSGTSFSTPRVTAAVASRLSAARRSGSTVPARTIAHELADGLVTDLFLGSDPAIGTRLAVP